MTYIQIEKNMTARPRLATPSMSAKDAWKIMLESDIRHLPVVESAKPVGILSERDLRQAMAVSDRAALTVGEIMTASPYCVSQGCSLLTVVREMEYHRYGCAIVVNSQGHVAGVFTRRDALRLLIQLLEKDPQGEIRRRGIEDYLSMSYLV